MTAPTLPGALLAWAETRGGDPFLCDDAGVLTWEGTLSAAAGIAAQLSAIGVARGDTVAVMAPNRRELVLTWFALGLLGAVEVPLNPAERGDRLAYLLDHSEATVAVVDGACMDAVDGLAGRLRHLRRVVAIDGTATAFPWEPLTRERAAADATTVVAVGPADPAAILYTSGSTGPPKGVVVSHGQHHTNGSQPVGLFAIGPADTVHVCLPLHHNMAQGYGVAAAVVAGAQLRLAPRFDAGTFLDDVRAHGSTVLPFVGAMLVLLAKQPARAGDADNPLRVGYGIPIPPALHGPFEDRFGLELSHCYGSTEATIVAWSAPTRRRSGAAGAVLPTHEVEVVDGAAASVSGAAAGEILVRARQPHAMFSGYWRDDARTARAWEGGWFHTGDRGRFDENGDLWFVDRLGDSVRVRGEMISSYEIEQAILGHPQVQLAAAFGVPSELTEEEVMLVVVPTPDAVLTAASVREWCGGRLPAFAVPRYVNVVEDIPMTATGKIEKFRLKEVGVTATTDDSRSPGKE